MVAPCKLEMLDKLDRRLLSELDLNSRRSNAAIAKRLGVGKNVVNYRIKQLVRRGIIRQFYAVVDVAKLGYFGIRTYIKFRHTTPKIEDGIIGSAVRNKHTWICERAEGAYSLAIVLWIKEMNDFYDFWFTFDEKYRHYFADVKISLYYEVQDFGNSFLSREGEATEPAITGGLGKEQVRISEADRRILGCLSSDARMPTLEIAKQVGVSPVTVKNRTTYLRRKGVILQFTVLLDRMKLGLVQYKMNFHLRDLSKYGEFVKLAKSQSQTLFINRTVGYADFEIEVLVDSYAMFAEILEEYKKRFPNEIVDYDTVIYHEATKVKYFEE